MITLAELSLQFAPMIGRWKADPVLASEIMSVPVKYNIVRTEEWISKNKGDSNQRLLGIFYSENSLNTELIGLYRLMFIDFESGVAEIGLYIGATEYQSKGLGKEIMKLGLDHAFKSLKLNKVFARIKSRNIRSRKTFENFGFSQEGILRNHYFDNLIHRFDDVHLVSLFREQYEVTR